MTDAFQIDAFLSLPRVANLALSPDGTRLVTTVSVPDAPGRRFTSALWALDPQGQAPPRRLTHSPQGETDPAFHPDGTLLFRSTRRWEPADDGEDQERSALWRLPAGGGEAQLIFAPPSGVDAVALARDAGVVVIGASLAPAATDWAADDEWEKARRQAGVSAKLFTGYPIRFWDHDLGPRQRRLAVLAALMDAAAGTLGADEPAAEPRIVTPHPERSLDEVDFDVTPDGATVVSGWRRDQGDPQRNRVDLVAIDVATGDLRTLREDGCEYSGVAASPTDAVVACVSEDPGAPDRAGDRTLALVDLDSGDLRDLLPQFDGWPTGPVWAPDGRALYFTADQDGRTLPFRVEVATGELTRLAAEGAFTDLCAAPGGDKIYALVSSVAHPPRAVSLDPLAADQEPADIPTPGDGVTGVGEVRRVRAQAADGQPVGAWLVLPAEEGQGRAPLVVLAHGGPYSSWTAWHWRWNPHVLAARGYAVLLPDPAPSTGYGQAFVARGWGRWGATTAADLDAAVDAALTLDQIDAQRVALAGGSFGGYLANWMAGHSDRFQAIVTHASLWSIPSFHGTTDLGVWWEREFGDPYQPGGTYEAASPDRSVANIRAPMLVIHGERDYRVPYSEALHLYTDLIRHTVEVSFLSFPDENHWIQGPHNARLWYETVLGFLDHHLRGADWVPSPLL